MQELNNWLAETWDANIFCQERTQLFRLSGYLHDQVELTETGRALTQNTPHTTSSPRARPVDKRAASASPNHQTHQAPHSEAPPNLNNHRAPPVIPRREAMQVCSHSLIIGMSSVFCQVWFDRPSANNASVACAVSDSWHILLTLLQCHRSHCTYLVLFIFC